MIQPSAAMQSGKTKMRAAWSAGTPLNLTQVSRHACQAAATAAGGYVGVIEGRTGGRVGRVEAIRPQARKEFDPTRRAACETGRRGSHRLALLHRRVESGGVGGWADHGRDDRSLRGHAVV